jgi:D-alanyl-D-alanine carboxypeptidase (penicillin-binding protein 5/6)
VKRDGRLLWAGAEDRRLPMASLAKMMTALLALERGEPERVVTVGRGVLAATGTRLGLKPGEQYSAGDLLAATVVRSANDACRALADDIARDFVARMNARAAALGMRDTRFADPCGHDREGQHSTAADLARWSARRSSRATARAASACATPTRCSGATPAPSA